MCGKWIPRSDGGSKDTDSACGKVCTDGKDRALIIHTATGDHLRQLEALFQDVLTTPAEER